MSGLKCWKQGAAGWPLREEVWAATCRTQPWQPTHQPQGKAEPISQASGASGKTYQRKDKKCWIGRGGEEICCLNVCLFVSHYPNPFQLLSNLNVFSMLSPFFPPEGGWWAVSLTISTHKVLILFSPHVPLRRQIEWAAGWAKVRATHIFSDTCTWKSSALGSPEQKREGVMEESPAKGRQNVKGTGASLQGKKAPARRRGGSGGSYNMWREGVKKMEPGYFKFCPQ